MRQIELAVTTSHNSDDMLPSEPMKKPLKKFSLDDDVVNLVSIQCDLIEDVIKNSEGVMKNRESEEKDSENVIKNSENEISVDLTDIVLQTQEENGDNLRFSPRSSRSSSLNSCDTKARSGYERNLLRKRFVIPDISFDYTSDDVKTDDEMKSKILDYKSDIERPSGFRKYSFNDKLRNLVDSAGKDSSAKALAFKKLMKSPSLLRKSNSFKNADSCVSSSAETSAATEQTEKRKKRKISLGKRRKISKHQLEKQQEDRDKPEKPERSTRSRRRKLTKSQSESSLSSLGVNRSKLILLYSGDAAIKSGEDAAVSKKNRLGTLKHTDSVESSSECDEYSSAMSDAELLNSPKPMRKPRRGLAKRVWKSINSLLFVADDQTPKSSIFSTPPLIRRNSTKSYKKSRSMPGGLNRIVSFSGQRKYSLDKLNEHLVKDDLVLLAREKNSLQKFSETMNSSKKKFRSSRENVKVEVRPGRSKSMDYLMDHLIMRKDSAGDWFQQRKKANSTLTPQEEKKISQKELDFKIMISHQPNKTTEKEPPLSQPHPLQPQPLQQTPPQQPVPKLTKSTTFDNGAPLTAKQKTMKSNTRRQEYVKIRLQDMKSVSQREMESFLSDKLFVPDQVNDWCRTLSESIKDRIIQITFDNYKVVAQIFIGALCDDGIHAAIQCTAAGQNKGKDDDNGFFTVTYKGKDLFAVASVLTFEL